MVETLRGTHGALVFEAMAVLAMYMTVGKQVPYEAFVNGKAERYLSDPEGHVDKLLEKRDYTPEEKSSFIDALVSRYEKRHTQGVEASPDFFRAKLEEVLFGTQTRETNPLAA